MPTSRSRRPPPRRRRRAGPLLVLLAAVVLVGGLVAVFQRGVGPLPDPEGCQARVEGVVVDLSTEQAENATLISAIAVRRGMPARAASIALATAYQESKLRNIAHGDRDSVGLFQQRPSQGWGTVEQLTDADYAVNAFYDELVELDGYQEMRITEAAQAVQRSGFPEAYEQHAEGARALASALTGWSPARFHCVVEDPEGEVERVLHGVRAVVSHRPQVRVVDEAVERRVRRGDDPAHRRSPSTGPAFGRVDRVPIQLSRPVVRRSATPYEELT